MVSVDINQNLGQHPQFSHLITPVRHNHGLSVNDPDFKHAYVTYVIPILRAGRLYFLFFLCFLRFLSFLQPTFY
jgi:hypothetical protein